MKKILIVCTANIARSPMAEALLNKKIEERKLSDHYHAESAGTWAVNGIPAPEDGQRVMQSFDLDTSSHSSREINEEIMNAADLVLTMESGHKEALQVEYPQYRDKIWLLSEVVGPPYDIPDPYMQGYQEYLEIAEELDRILDRGIDKIINLADESD